MQPTRTRLYDDWCYSLCADLQHGIRMAECAKKYSVTEAQITNIFFNVMREAKGLPPIAPSPSRVVPAISGRVFPLELDDDDKANK